ncbi:ShlB/FhaC/HecB family hemolysin secretion/activation protein [Ottowia thiooxydans]|uniref:ShlB/FhaC/HecB family hemolysin secretion/activation protein n=1 Tax=Ottowia thiooxydans TaxID=219182 RepID=UPI001B7F9E79|nr:ShlB/FhaC/HecB family hemolysin secretion/activation protein [Ottowia thiooxydans]
MRRETQRLQEQPSEPARDALQPPGPKAVVGEIPRETPCFDIQRIELSGPMVEKFEWLRDAAKPWLQSCLGVQGIRQLASALDGALLEAGYATSKVTLPPQNLTDGTLHIQLHAGRIAAVEGERGLFWEGAFPIASGDLLNVRNLDQGVEQMNRLSSRVVQTQLEPGQEPDTSVVRIVSKPTGSRLRGGLTLDNSGSPALGRPQLSANVAFDNPTGLNDLISASVNTNLKNPGADHRSQSLGLSYSIPWGYNLFTLSANATRFAQQVQLTTASVTSSGRSHGIDLRWDRTVWRNQSSKMGLFGGVSIRRARSFIDDVELVVQNRRNSFANLGLNYKHLFRRASLDAELSFRKGMGWFGAEPDYDRQISLGLTLRPQIWNASVALDVPDLLNRRASAQPGQAVRPIGLRSSVRLQYTKDTTLTLDQFSIGSRGTVRGFDGTSTLLAESGFAWRNELTMPLQIGSLPAMGYLAVDIGRVWGPSSAQLIGRHLAGVALGVRSQWRQIHLDLVLAMPIAKPSGFRSARVSPYMSLTYAF